MKTFFSRWLPVLLWMAFIFYVSSSSTPYQDMLPQSMQTPGGVKFPDTPVGQLVVPNESAGQISHLGMFFVLGFLLARAFHGRGGAGLIFGLALAALYALSDEIHQLFIPVRAFQISDLALDVLGALLGIMIYTKLTEWLDRRKQKVLF